VARTVRDARLDTRAARDKLKVSPKPYWRGLEPGLHIGYAKGKRARSWMLRRYIGAERYAVETIGAADDIADADGERILTFHQAQSKARERALEIAEAERIANMGPVVTVRSAIEDYLTSREAREAKGHNETGLKRDARSRLRRHLIDADEKLAGKPLAALTTDDLAKWRAGLKMAPASVQRTSNDLKAALNAAARRHRPQLPPTIRDTIKDGLASLGAAPAAARDMQILPDSDIRALISAAWEVDTEGDWGGDLARLVLVLAATGARFSQIVRMTVADVQATRVMVPVSRKGRGEKQTSHVAVRVGEDVLAALKHATAGRKGSETLLLRPRWEPVAGAVARWQKGARGPWHSASELNRPWATILSRAGLAKGTVPYALRHSSIVRGLRASLPVRLVAALHDTSSAMIERHYSRFILDAMDELAARAVVPLTTAPATVTEIRIARKG